KTKWVIGGEAVFDEADTQVFSDQNYRASYVSAEYWQNKFTYLAGIRLNQWDIKAKLKPGRDAEIAGDLVGVSGSSVPKKETATTYATGIVYALNENNNISLNYSKTNRVPSLMERFSFGNFTGGGLSLHSEEADNFDAAWKYYDGLFSASLSVFYSDFENYISVKQRRKITNAAAFETCIRQGKCDPANGEFDDREDEFFSDDFPYFNVKQVVNRGFEVSLKRVSEADYETGLSFSFSDFDVRAGHDPSDVNLVLSDSNPLEFNYYYKRYLSDGSAAPWVKINARYVTNTPSVSQEDGFSPFFVTDLFAGFKTPVRHFSEMTFNAGIRNLSDMVYHEPFSPLDGLKRSFFFNIGFELG
ncbi:TonB-dependent receptor, partial [Nitrospira defluvii]|nr:TonB-dependent receptor [Nitrospira defluvii]